MEKLIGRNRETDLLAKYLNSKRPEFVAVYGRRRVGKTFLIRQFFNDNFDFYCTGIISGSKAEQLNAFNTALKRYGHQGQKAKNWMEAFEYLASLIKKKSSEKKRCIVFIDELPCFDTKRSGFVHALDFFWNSQGSWIDNIFFIICGSATSWMIRNVIDNHGGLHNRITHEIHLLPFTLSQTEEYIRYHKCRWDRLSILHTYMAMGGVPYYLSLLDLNVSVAENIDNLFFADDAELRKEYQRLFKSLYNHPDGYLNVVSCLAKHKTGMTRSELAKALKVQNNGHFGDILADLVNCDFLRLYNNGLKQNNGIYQLIDFYTLFYHQFCLKRTTDDHYWRKTINTPIANTWFGLSYKRVCIAHFRQIIKALHYDTIRTEFYSWRNPKGEPAVQIDMVIDRSDNMVTICEVKYSKAEYTLDKTECERIIKRADTYAAESRCRKGVEIAIITTFGLKENQYSDVAQHTLSIDDLFQ